MQTFVVVHYLFDEHLWENLELEFIQAEAKTSSSNSITLDSCKASNCGVHVIANSSETIVAKMSKNEWKQKTKKEENGLDYGYEFFLTWNELWRDLEQVGYNERFSPFELETDSSSGSSSDEE
jgi:hypothetical protein